MKTSLLDAFRLTIQEQNLGVYGIRVHRRGQDDLVHFWRSNDKVCLYSGSKTFTALAVGLAQDEGRLGLDDPVLGFFPEYRSVASPGSEAITLRHLLHMQSGKGEFWFAGGPDRQKSGDWAELFFRDPQKDVPGTKFVYSNACTYMLSRVVGKVSGQTLRDYLVPRLFDPLDMFNPQWHSCPGGHSLGATELFLTNEEFSRLGRLMLDGGVWNGKPLVGAGYLKELCTDMVPSGGWGEAESDAGYGYQVWRCTHPGAYRADGMYGQFSIVFPAEEAVVTVTSHEERRANDILRYVYRDIVPRLG